MSELTKDVARHRLARRLTRAVGELEDPATPMVVVDLDAFDANAEDLLRRAGGTPIRVASKSLRVPDLLSRALARDGFRGVLSYALREAAWLVEQQITDDVVMGYPSLDAAATRRILGEPRLRAAITFMIDDPAHLDVLEANDPAPGGPPARVAIDIDAGLRIGPGHLGPKRSPLHSTEDVMGCARSVVARGFALVGVMTYEGQVAGVPDVVPDQVARSLAVRRIKDLSLRQLTRRRAEVRAALAEITELEFWNAGGSGSIEETAADAAVTEVAAGSGLLVPTLFDHYASFTPRPAAFFGARVVRRPSPDLATVSGGGLIASGPVGADRAPTPWAPPGLQLTGLEGAGEVQTPLTGPTASRLSIGDWVWFRHAKAGELAEHTNVVHLLQGESLLDPVVSYRGAGQSW